MLDLALRWGAGVECALYHDRGADRHEALGESQALGRLDPDPEWAPRGAVPIVREIQDLYEDKALLVLENSPQRAWDNLGWVELALKG